MPKTGNRARKDTRGAAALWRGLRAARQTVTPAILLLALANPASPAFGQPESAWGPIPPPSDSTAAVFEDRGMPVWEHALVWPYRIVTFPVTAAAAGLGAGIVWLDENKVIYEIQELLKPPTVPFGFDARFKAGGLSGLGAGVTFYHDDFPGHGNHFRVGFLSTLRGAHDVHSGVRVGEIEAGAGYRIRKAARFYGIGPDSRLEDESFYTGEVSWGGLGFRKEAGPLEFALTAGLSTAGSRGPRETEEPTVRETFADNLPYGFGRRSDGLSFGLEVLTETAHETGRPETGGIHRAKAVYFSGLGDDENVGFWNYRGEIQRFVPLWFSNRALALRGVMSWIDPTGDSPIPFQRLISNDDPDLFRGYQDLRFRDRGLALVSAEYRWPVWAPRDVSGPGVDAYLLSDVGQVFGTFDELSFRKTTVSWGGGFRLIGGRGFTARVEIATSKEGTQLRLGADQVFQYFRTSLLEGKSPVPER